MGTLRKGLAPLIFMILYFAFATFSLSVFFIRFKRKQWALLFFGLFMMIMALRWFSTLPLMLLALNIPFAVQTILQGISIILIFAPLAGFVAQHLTGNRRRIMDWIWRGHFLAGVVYVLAAILVPEWLQAHEGAIYTPLTLFMIFEGSLMMLFMEWEVKVRKCQGYLHMVTLACGVLLFSYLYSGLAYLGVLPYDPVLILIVDLGVLCFADILGFNMLRYLNSQEEELRSIREEMTIARKIQQALLPRVLPRIRGLVTAVSQVPMREVGGDLYDFLEPNDHSLGVLMADVSGHGVPAALIASMVKANFSSQYHNTPHPEQVLATLNRNLCGQIEKQFVTAGLLYVDVEAKSLRYASAGHLPLLCLRRESGDILEFNARGGLLGYFPELLYESTTSKIHSGDRLVLYTDGILEARSLQDREFGEEQFFSLMRSEANTDADRLCKRIIEAVRDWTSEPTPQDDLTLAIVDVE